MKVASTNLSKICNFQPFPIIFGVLKSWGCACSFPKIYRCLRSCHLLAISLPSKKYLTFQISEFQNFNEDFFRKNFFEKLSIEIMMISNFRYLKSKMNSVKSPLCEFHHHPSCISDTSLLKTISFKSSNNENAYYCFVICSFFFIVKKLLQNLSILFIYFYGSMFKAPRNSKNAVTKSSEVGKPVEIRH